MQTCKTSTDLFPSLPVVPQDFVKYAYVHVLGRGRLLIRLKRKQWLPIKFLAFSFVLSQSSPYLEYIGQGLRGMQFSVQVREKWLRGLRRKHRVTKWKTYIVF